MPTVPHPIAFPVPDPHYAYVRTRRRNSGLTSVRWYDEHTLFAGDFAAKRVYRVKPFSDRPIDAEIATLDGRGDPTATDLMDLRGDTMVMTNFYTGEVAFYSVGPGTLRFERVMTPPARPQRRKRRSLRSLLRPAKPHSAGRKVHGAVFVPGYANLLWVSYCDARDPGIEVVTLDGAHVHSLTTLEQAQDVAFLEHDGVTFAMQAARTNHISTDGPKHTDMYVTLYVYRLPRDLTAEAPALVATQRFSGHLDALKSFGSSVYAANQHDSCVDEFSWSPRTNEVTLRQRIEGFDMPHGLDIRHDGLMAVTNYGPANDMRFVQLPVSRG